MPGPEALFSAPSRMPSARPTRNPALGGAFSTYQINVPQLDVDVDRVKVKRQNVKLSDVFETLQVYLGSLYVNDFNRFGRTYQVVAQADAPFRVAARGHPAAEDPQCRRRNGAAGLRDQRVAAPSGRTSCSATTPTAPRTSTADPPRASAPDQAQAAMAKILGRDLPRGMSYRVDRSRLPAADLRQHGDAGVPAVRAVRVPGARRAVREPEPAARHRADRADVPAAGASAACCSIMVTTTSSRRSACWCWWVWPARTPS